ncbi:MAG: hypothetical protein GY711_10330 [bacterium]|nr:hypothetical protein [bacterium]
MMTILLDILLGLALISAILAIVSSFSPTGPEGDWGTVYIAMLATLLFGVLLLVLSIRGEMDSIPGGGFVQFLTAIGLLTLFMISLMGASDCDNRALRGLLISTPFLLLAGGLIAINGASLPARHITVWVARGLLGGGGIIGWGLAVAGFSTYMKESQAKLEAKQREVQEQDDQNRREEAARFEEIGKDASLVKLLQYMFSQNPDIRQSARKRITDFPDLDECLIELLNGKSEDVVDYIAKVHEAPPKKLETAFGAMLERKQKSWSFIQHEDNPGNRASDLTVYFQGAGRIQQAGGDLRPQLQLWHALLLKCRGLEGLAATVQALL